MLHVLDIEFIYNPPAILTITRGTAFQFRLVLLVAVYHVYAIRTGRIDTGYGIIAAVDEEIISLQACIQVKDKDMPQAGSKIPAV